MFPKTICYTESYHIIFSIVNNTIVKKNYQDLKNFDCRYDLLVSISAVIMHHAFQLIHITFYIWAFYYLWGSLLSSYLLSFFLISFFPRHPALWFTAFSYFATLYFGACVATSKKYTATISRSSVRLFPRAIALPGILREFYNDCGGGEECG